MRIRILTNGQKPAAKSYEATLRQELEGMGQQLLDASQAGRADLVILLGGDGTLLRRLPSLLEWQTPVLAVGFGRVNYLAACTAESFSAYFSRVLSGSAPIAERRILCCKLKKGDRAEEEQKLYALNEVALHRCACPRALRMEVTRSLPGGEEIPDRFTGDGLLCATATGSTAYNRSAGGVVLLPEDERFTLTPICPYFATASAQVLQPNTVVRIHLEAPEGAAVTADSNRIFPIAGETLLEITEDLQTLPIYLR